MEAIKKVVDLLEDNEVPVLSLEKVQEMEIKGMGRSIDGTAIEEGSYTELTLTVLVRRYD